MRDGNRVQQTDYSGSQPVATTYVNDNLGLSQVLAATSGITTTHNLYGRDLISQDDGGQTRTLLTDGLGSVRQEMVGGAVETVTTYEPFGNLLAQTDPSGTTYGFTGEQHDAAMGLVYLRARYYNPALRVFLSRDPFPGTSGRPSTQHGYIYVSNNPVNKTDAGGLCEEIGDDNCWSYAEYMYMTYYIDWYYVGGLTIEQMKFLERLGELMKRAYRPSVIGDEPRYGPEPFGTFVGQPTGGRSPDGISVFGSLPSDTLFQLAPISVGPVVAIEYLYNFHTHDATLFAVLGGNMKVGTGLVIDDIAVSYVYNIGKNNLNYSGDFNALNATASGFSNSNSKLGVAYLWKIAL